MSGERAYALFDLKRHTLVVGLNTETAFPCASLSKIGTALLCLRKFEPDKLIPISSASMLISHTFREANVAGDLIRASDLIALMLVSSDNGAALALAEAFNDGMPFSAQIARLVQGMGCRSTTFQSPNGLPPYENYSSCRDLFLIAEKALEHSAFRQAIAKRSIFLRTLKHGKPLCGHATNKLLFADRRCLGVKTGYTAKAGYCHMGLFEQDDASCLTIAIGSDSRKSCFAKSVSLADRYFSRA